MKHTPATPLDLRRPLRDFTGDRSRSILDPRPHDADRQILTALRNIQVRYGPKPGLYLGHGQSTLVIPKPPRPRGKELTRLRVHEIFGDYLVCRAWDGDEEGETDIYVAKQYLLRNSITQRTLYGVTIDYEYDVADTQHRTATGSNGEIEDQWVTPPYSVDDEIWAEPADTGVEVPETEEDPAIPVTLIDLAERAWATQDDEEA